MIIGITGYKRSGKDTAARIIADYLPSFDKYAFADPVKEACSKMFNLPLYFFHDDYLKEQIIEFWDMSPRYMMKILATEGGRDLFRKDMWIHRMVSEYETALAKMRNGLIISDVRFPNQTEKIREYPNLMIRIDGSEQSDDHESEEYIDKLDVDYVVKNDDTMNMFEFNLRENVLNKEGLIGRFTNA